MQKGVKDSNPVFWLICRYLSPKSEVSSLRLGTTYDLRTFFTLNEWKNPFPKRFPVKKRRRKKIKTLCGV